MKLRIPWVRHQDIFSKKYIMPTQRTLRRRAAIVQQLIRESETAQVELELAEQILKLLPYLCLQMRSIRP